VLPVVLRSERVVARWRPLGGGRRPRRGSRPPVGVLAGGHRLGRASILADVDTATEQLIASLEALLDAASLDGPTSQVVPLEDWAAEQA
jgi:hypothetical protein